jgi:hypothetical protein
LNLLVNGAPVDAVSRVLHTSQVDRVGRSWVEKFKEHVERQMFEVIIQGQHTVLVSRYLFADMFSCCWSKNRSSRHYQAVPKGRLGQAACKRPFAQKETAREAEGGPEEAPSGGLCCNRARSVPKVPGQVDINQSSVSWPTQPRNSADSRMIFIGSCIVPGSHFTTPCDPTSGKPWYTASVFEMYQLRVWSSCDSTLWTLVFAPTRVTLATLLTCFRLTLNGSSSHFQPSLRSSARDAADSR